MTTQCRLLRVLSLSVASLLIAEIPAVSQARAAAAPDPAALQQDQKASENPPQEEPKPEPKKKDKPPKEERTPPSKPANPPQTRTEQKERGSKVQSPAQNHPRPAQGQVRYQFRAQDTAKLRQYYQSRLKSVDPAHRSRLVVGGSIAREVVTYIEPVPVEIVEVLAVPAGYVVGYWDGYCIVYDPNTLIIVAVVDLLIV
jgi:hypothetical protein